jgi:hypothetical protein
LGKDFRLKIFLKDQELINKISSLQVAMSKFLKGPVGLTAHHLDLLERPEGRYLTRRYKAKVP